MEDSTLVQCGMCLFFFRKSLQGLDTFVAEGAQAFEDLCSVAERLGQHGMGTKWAEATQAMLKAGKNYLKTDYKVELQYVWCLRRAFHARDIAHGKVTLVQLCRTVSMLAFLRVCTSTCSTSVYTP